MHESTRSTPTDACSCGKKGGRREDLSHPSARTPGPKLQTLSDAALLGSASSARLSNEQVSLHDPFRFHARSMRTFLSVTSVVSYTLASPLTIELIVASTDHSGEQTQISVSVIALAFWTMPTPQHTLERNPAPTRILRLLSIYTRWLLQGSHTAPCVSSCVDSRMDERDIRLGHSDVPSNDCARRPMEARLQEVQEQANKLTKEEARLRRADHIPAQSQGTAR